MTDQNLLLQDDAFAPAAPDSLEHLPSHHCASNLSDIEHPEQHAKPDAPDCGACPGDGSICKTSCKVADESPTIVAAPAVAPEECWSANNEEFNCSTLGDLMDRHEELKVGDTVYVGEARHPGASELCDADDILEMMGDRAGDIAGEYADDYPDVTNEAKAELDALLASWIARHASPGFYTVSNARPYILSADDFECKVSQ